jgi:hypothetical protein
LIDNPRKSKEAKNPLEIAGFLLPEKLFYYGAASESLNDLPLSGQRTASGAAILKM